MRLSEGRMKDVERAKKAKKEREREGERESNESQARTVPRVKYDEGCAKIFGRRKGTSMMMTMMRRTRMKMGGG